jgi:hypothetical protein
MFFLPRAGYHEVFIRLITANCFYLLTATCPLPRAFHNVKSSLTEWVMLQCFSSCVAFCVVHSARAAYVLHTAWVCLTNVTYYTCCIPRVRSKVPYSTWRIHVLYSTCGIPRAVLHVPYARPLLQMPYSACCIPRVIFHVRYSAWHALEIWGMHLQKWPDPQIDSKSGKSAVLDAKNERSRVSGPAEI